MLKFKKETFKINERVNEGDDDRVVPGYVCGNIGIHKEGDKEWRVTHIDSGDYVGCFRTKKLATMFVGAASELPVESPYIWLRKNRDEARRMYDYRIYLSEHTYVDKITWEEFKKKYRKL